MLFLGVLAGYITGTVLALVLDRLYTGAPWRGPLRLCVEPLASTASLATAPDGRSPDSADDGSSPIAGAPPAVQTLRFLAVYERLPWHVLTGTPGYLLAGGRCPSGRQLAARLWYLPLLGTGAGAAVSTWAVDARHAALTALFAVFLLAFVGTDFERHLLPDRLMYPALALGVALCWAWPDRSAAGSLLGGALGFGAMFLVFVALPGFGFGDVKLAGLLGLVTGLTNTLPALAVGAIAGGVGAGVMLLLRRADRRTPIAYGPYLAFGAFVGMLAR